MNNENNRRIEISKKSKTALICSGGAAKAGAYHLGVALALQEKGFKFVGGLKGQPDEAQQPSTQKINIYVGSSAGSIICTYLAAGYSLDQIFDSFLGKKHGASASDGLGPHGRELKRLTYATMFSLRKDEGILSTISALADASGLPNIRGFVRSVAKDSFETIFRWKWLKWAGLFSTRGIEKYLREDVLPTNDFKELAADLFIVGTQLNHSRKVVFGKYAFASDDKTVIYTNDVPISDACAASTALPFVFEPWPITHQAGFGERGHKIYYFDGEIRDTLSTHVGFDTGADLIIASHTHQPYHYTKEIGSLHQYGIPSVLIQALYLMIERKIQTVIKTTDRNRIALDSVSEFFKTNGLPEDLRKQCLEMLERKLHFKAGVDYIYIHPKPRDHQMFFGDHFNLSGKKMSEIVKLGFRSAIDTLRKYEFV